MAIKTNLSEVSATLRISVFFKPVEEVLKNRLQSVQHEWD